MTYTTLFWLVAAGAFLLFEAAHPGLFVFLSFCFGALAGAFLSWLGYSLVHQASLALIVTIIAAYILIRWLKDYLRHIPRDQLSNYYAMVGKKGVIVQHSTPKEFGQVKINGELWAYRSVHDEPLAIGDEVEVIMVRGAHVVVRKSMKG
jgi:membrane protein implicated in regulation of membrane protease activity